MTKPTNQSPPVEAFEFPEPAYSQLPNVLFDRFMSELTPPQFLVFLYVARRTFGFHRQYATISITQFTDGLILSDGRKVDGGTGLARRTVFEALAELERRWLIVVRRGVDAAGVKQTNTYTLRVRMLTGELRLGDELGPEPVPDEEGVQNLHTIEQKAKGGSAPDALPPVQGSAPDALGVVRQMHHLIRNRKKGGNKAPPAPRDRGGRRLTPKPTERKPPALAAPACGACHGFGLLGNKGMSPMPHSGTLAAVRVMVGEWDARTCTCEVGQGWGELLKDERAPKASQTTR